MRINFERLKHDPAKPMTIFSLLRKWGIMARPPISPKEARDIARQTMGLARWNRCRSYEIIEQRTYYTVMTMAGKTGTRPCIDVDCHTGHVIRKWIWRSKQPFSSLRDENEGQPHGYLIESPTSTTATLLVGLPHKSTMDVQQIIPGHGTPAMLSPIDIRFRNRLPLASNPLGSFCVPTIQRRDPKGQEDMNTEMPFEDGHEHQGHEASLSRASDLSVPQRDGQSTGESPADPEPNRLRAAPDEIFFMALILAYAYFAVLWFVRLISLLSMVAFMGENLWWIIMGFMIQREEGLPIRVGLKQVAAQTFYALLFVVPAIALYLWHWKFLRLP